MSEPLKHRRKIAIATWRAPHEGRIHANIQIDVTGILAFIESKRHLSITLTHLVGAALARAIAANPEVNGRIFLGRFRSFPRVDIGFAVDIESGSDLAPCRVLNADKKTALEISKELIEGARRLRARDDAEYERSIGWVRFVPSILMRPLMSFFSAWSGGLGRRAFGQPGHPLGSGFVSNVGRFEMREAYLAPLPFARAPIYLAIGEIHEAPLVVQEQIQIRKVVIITAVADHRIIDGAHAGKLIKSFKGFLNQPALLLEG